MMKILYDGITISYIEDYFVLNINMAVLWPQVAEVFFFLLAAETSGFD